VFGRDRVATSTATRSSAGLPVRAKRGSAGSERERGTEGQQTAVTTYGVAEPVEASVVSGVDAAPATAGWVDTSTTVAFGMLVDHSASVPWLPLPDPPVWDGRGS
jgi:hypothetical protein